MASSADVFGMACLIILIILTLFGNTLICTIILRNRRLRISSNIFVVNIALGDILCSVSTLPLSILFLMSQEKWPLGSAGYIIFDAAWLFFLILSFLNIEIITLDRFFAITKPYTYESIATNKRSVTLCVCIWTYVLVLVCGLIPTFHSADNRIYEFHIPGNVYYSVLIIHAGLTCISVPILYAILLHLAKKQKKKIIEQTNNRTSRHFFRELRATWTIGFVISLFILVWLPFLINQFVDFDDINDGRWDYKNRIMAYITYCNGPVNIFLYSLWNREMRGMILKFFSFKNAQEATRRPDDRNQRITLM